MVAAPACQIAYLPEDTNLDEISREENLESEEVLDVPVYIDAQRSVLICSLPVGCPRDERDVWLRRGIAFHLTSF